MTTKSTNRIQKLIAVRFKTSDGTFLGPIIVIIDAELKKVIGMVGRL